MKLSPLRRGEFEKPLSDLLRYCNTQSPDFISVQGGALLTIVARLQFPGAVLSHLQHASKAIDSSHVPCLPLTCLCRHIHAIIKCIYATGLAIDECFDAIDLRMQAGSCLSGCAYAPQPAGKPLQFSRDLSPPDIRVIYHQLECRLQ